MINNTSEPPKNEVRYNGFSSHLGVKIYLLMSVLFEAFLFKIAQVKISYQITIHRNWSWIFCPCTIWSHFNFIWLSFYLKKKKKIWSESQFNLINQSYVNINLIFLCQKHQDILLQVDSMSYFSSVISIYNGKNMLHPPPPPKKKKSIHYNVIVPFSCVIAQILSRCALVMLQC